MLAMRRAALHPLAHGLEVWPQVAAKSQVRFSASHSSRALVLLAHPPACSGCAGDTTYIKILFYYIKYKHFEYIIIPNGIGKTSLNDDEEENTIHTLGSMLLY